MEILRCELCKSEMEIIDKKFVVDTEYKILKCKKCKHTVAKS
jgi:hypothetical protein